MKILNALALGTALAAGTALALTMFPHHAHAESAVALYHRGSGSYLQAAVNGRMMEFQLDTGADATCLTLADYRSVGGDVIGEAELSDANGGHQTVPIIRLRSVQLGGYTVTNVKATVGCPNSLLGQTVLRMFGSYTIDNQRNRLVLAAPDDQPRTTYAPPPTAPAQGQGYADGQRDRIAWQRWLNSLDDETRAGAGWQWEHRNENTSCDIGNSSNWVLGCNETKRWLALARQRALRDPGYQAGWLAARLPE